MLRLRAGLVFRGGGECTADFKMYCALSFCLEMTAILGCAQLRERPSTWKPTQDSPDHHGDIGARAESLDKAL